MATDQVLKDSEEKKGGPYTKQEQEERRDKVYELHFEKGYSAVTIAQMLGVNRNTVNTDIQYWYGQLAYQVTEKNLSGMLLKQIERLDAQRKRLYDEIEKQSDFLIKLRLEKMVLDIDNKIAGYVSKIMGKDLRSDKYDTTEEILEDELSGIVRYLIFDSGNLHSDSTSEKNIMLDTIKMKKCDIQYARNVLNTMKKLGLELCKNYGSTPTEYDLLKFASIRGYITKEELTSYFKKRQEKKEQEEKRCQEIEEKYAKKYGKDESKWPPGVVDMMEKELLPDSSLESRYGF